MLLFQPKNSTLSKNIVSYSVRTRFYTKQQVKMSISGFLPPINVRQTLQNQSNRIYYNTKYRYGYVAQILIQ